MEAISALTRPFPSSREGVGSEAAPHPSPCPCLHAGQVVSLRTGPGRARRASIKFSDAPLRRRFRAGRERCTHLPSLFLIVLGVDVAAALDVFMFCSTVIIAARSLVRVWSETITKYAAESSAIRSSLSLGMIVAGASATERSPPDGHHW